MATTRRSEAILVERLVVEAVDLDLLDAERLVEPAAGLDGDRVARVGRHFVGALERGAFDLLPRLPAPVGGVLGPLGLDRDVLDERAAEGDVEDLDAAAHAEDGQPAVERALGELELEGVAERLGRRQVLGRLLAVARGIDVAASAEEDPVAGIQRIFEVPVHARKPQPDAARQGHRALEADRGVVAEVVQAQGEPDHRFAPVTHH